MKTIQLVVRRRVRDQVDYNDGDLISIQTHGLEGIEKNILMQQIQIHRFDTEDTPDAFRHRFPVGTWLEIGTIIEINSEPTHQRREHYAP